MTAPQGSDEWLAEKCGKHSASNHHRTVTPTFKPRNDATKRAYSDELTSENLTGLTTERPVTGPMRWGQETEDDADREYVFRTGLETIKTGFIAHPTIALSGCSPDRLIGDDGGLEIKCPESKTHLALLEGGEIKHEWICQIHWCLEVTGRAWWDFASYDPRMPYHLQLHVRRIERDAEILKTHREIVKAFTSEIEARVDALMNGTRAAQAA